MPYGKGYGSKSSGKKMGKKKAMPTLNLIKTCMPILGPGKKKKKKMGGKY